MNKTITSLGNQCDNELSSNICRFLRRSRVKYVRVIIYNEIVIVILQSIPSKKTAPNRNTSLFDELACALNLELPPSPNPPESDLFKEPLNPESGIRRSLSEELSDMNDFTSSSLRVPYSSRFPAQMKSDVTDKFRLQEATLLQKLSVKQPEDYPSTSLTKEPKHSVTWSTNVIPSLTERNTITNSSNASAFGTNLPHFHLQNSFISYTDSLIGYHNGQWINRVQLRKRFVSISKYSISCSIWCTIE